MSSRDIQESSKKSSTRIRNDSKSILAALRHGVDNIIRIPGQKMQSGMTERVPPNNDLRRCSNIGIEGQKTQSQVVEICPLEQSSRQCQRESSEPYMYSEEFVPLPKKKGPAIYKTMPTERSLPEQSSRQCPDSNAQFLSQQNQSKLKKRTPPFRNSEEKNLGKNDMGSSHPMMEETHESESSEHYMASEELMPLPKKGGPAIYKTMPTERSRKGYARLEAEMRKESLDPSSITRADVWEKGHTRKNGEPSNREVAEKMRKLHEIKATQPEISSADLKNDAISQVFGDEYRGRVRVYGFGVSPSDVGLISQNQEVIFQLGQQVTELTQKVGDIDALKQEMQQHINEKREMQEQLKNMQNLVSQLLQSQDNASKLPATSTIAPQAPSEGLSCKLFRMDKDDIVAEGRWVTDDPKTKVHGRELGNNASKVWVTKAIEPRSKVWRPTNGIEVMEEAEGSTIAWPTDHVIKDCT